MRTLHCCVCVSGIVGMGVVTRYPRPSGHLKVALLWAPLSPVRLAQSGMINGDYSWPKSSREQESPRLSSLLIESVLKECGRAERRQEETRREERCHGIDDPNTDLTFLGKPGAPPQRGRGKKVSHFPTFRIRSPPTLSSPLRL